MTQQSKILPASQVQNNFGAIAKQVRSGEYQDVVVENRGEPVVAIVNVEELQALREFREQEKRKEAFSKLRALRAKILARSKNKLTDAEAMKIADRFSHELVEDLVKEGKIKFDRRSS